MGDIILLSNLEPIKFIKFKKNCLSYDIINSHETLEACKTIFKNVSWLRKEDLSKKKNKFIWAQIIIR